MSVFMKKIGSRSGLIGIFIASFLLFSLIAFPYEILKESVGNGLSRALGVTVTMDDLAAALPLGVKASGLSVRTSGAKPKTVEISRLTIRVNPLYLFALKAGVRATLENKDGSTLTAFVSIPVLSLLGKGPLVPGAVEVDAEKFRIDDFISLGLGALAGSRGMNPLLAPVLEGLGVSGKLQGQLRMSLNASSPQDSKGDIDLKLVDGFLKLSDPSLGLPDQRLTRAGVKGALTAGILTVDSSSGLDSDELTVSASGAVAVKTPLGNSQLQLEVLVKLKKSLEEKFGFLLGAFSGGTAKNGEIRIQVKGPLTNPQTETI